MSNSKKVRLTKDDIARMVGRDTHFYQGQVIRIIDSILEHITEELAKGNEIQFHGFGMFEMKERAARTGRNPHTNEPVPIPARVIPSFKPGQALKDAVIKNK